MTTLLPTIHYIPQQARSTKDIDIAQRRILLVAEPGEGKTYTSLTTSPSPIIIDLDNGITDQRLVKLNVPHIPLYDELYCKEVLKKNIRCNALLEFLKVDGIKLAKDQTLIIDSLTALQDSVHEHCWSIVKKSKDTQEPDVRDYWYKIKDYWVECFTLLMRLRCHVIVTAHLAEKRDKENGLLLGYGPMIDGSIRQQIGRFFTDVIRQHAREKKVGTDKVVTEYVWQVKTDNWFKAKSRADVDGIFIPASFNYLLNLGVTAEEKTV